MWLARDLFLDRRAALKLLNRAERDANVRSERLRAEARALAALDHPCVVRIYDVGQHEDRDYIVMEYCEQGSLSERLAAGPVPPHEAATLLQHVLSALAVAHRAGIVHRDVKPGNVLVRADGTIALGDFGIARTADGPDTRTGIALGSMGFMAPEQRVDARRAGPQADLYAAACTLYNLVTADTPIDLFLAQDSSPRWEPVPAPLRPFLRKATRSEPSARFHDAAEMSDALSLVLPALEGQPAARGPRSDSPPIGYLPTRDDSETEPSLKAEQRERKAGLDEWAWANAPRRPVGRTALWIGTTTLLFATVAGLMLGPLAEEELLSLSLAERAAPAKPLLVVPSEAPALEGQWRGTFGGHSGVLSLHGTPSALSGEVALSLGAHELHTVVTGSFDATSRELVLVESQSSRPATYRARLFPNDLILEGALSRADEAPLPFALVRQ